MRVKERGQGTRVKETRNASEGERTGRKGTRVKETGDESERERA